MEGGSSLNPLVSAYLFVLSNTGRGIGTENRGMDDVFPTDTLWFGSDTFTNFLF